MFPPQSDEILELIFENNPAPMAYMDLKFNFIKVNNAYASADGKSPDFFPGKNHFVLYPNTENEKIFSKVLKTGEPYAVLAKPFEYAESPDRGKSYWDWSLAVIKEDEQPVGLLLQVLDVTAKVEAEKSLYEKARQEVHLYDEELEKIIESRTKLLQAAIEQLKEENQVRIKAESLMLKAKEEAERANVSKSQFLSRMSHELRTPLNAILGFSQLLQTEGLNEEQNSFVDEVMLAGKHLLAMITDILDLSRIETGQLSVSLTDVSLNNIVKQSIALVEHKLNFRNIEVHNLLSESGEELTLRVDETRMKEVIVNLLTNAIKYNSDNGLVSIGYKRLGSGHIRIFVSDTGKGLDTEEQIGIFEPFNRLGAEYTDIEGVGIGLTIAQKLMELMGGRIGVESEKGKGSTFYLDCPLSKELYADSNDKEEIFDLSGVNKNYRILYIEDNKANQRVVEKLLQHYPNFELILADTAEDGLYKTHTSYYDLIILDINLPGMDGYAALEDLKNDAQTRDIPVIALSASVSPDDIQKGLDAGFNQYLTKPVILPNLMSIIQQELGG